MSDLNFVCSFFSSLKLISPSLILLIRPRALSKLPKSSLGVLSLHLNTNLIVLTFLSRFFILSKLSSVSLLDISFSFKTIGLLKLLNFSTYLIGLLS